MKYLSLSFIVFLVLTSQVTASNRLNPQGKSPDFGCYIAEIDDGIKFVFEDVVSEHQQITFDPRNINTPPPGLLVSFPSSDGARTHYDFGIHYVKELPDDIELTYENIYGLDEEPIDLSLKQVLNGKRKGHIHKEGVLIPFSLSNETLFASIENNSVVLHLKKIQETSFFYDSAPGFVNFWIFWGSEPKSCAANFQTKADNKKGSGHWFKHPTEQFSETNSR